MSRIRGQKNAPIGRIAMYAIGVQMANTPKNRSFGDWLRDKRAEKHISGPELERRSGVSRQFVSDLERNTASPKTGRLVKPTVEKVDALARGLGVSISEARLAAGYAPPDRPPDTELTLDMIMPSGYDELGPEEQAQFRLRLKRIGEALLARDD